MIGATIIKSIRPPLRGLYAITDPRLTPEQRLFETVEAALDGGAHWIQYRDKGSDRQRRLREARKLRELCHTYSAGLIINDDLELAIACAADGLHIGQNDIPLAEARIRLGTDAVIGVSCYNRIDIAQAAAAQSADYLAFGSFYPSPTKPDTVIADQLLLRAARDLGVPICAIGGINPDNAWTLVKAGADLIAVISALFGADDTRTAARRLAALYENDSSAN